MKQATDGYLNIRDGNVYCEAAGEGTPIVFLHAAFLDSRMWEDQWHDFSQRSAVLRFDMLGFGRSDRLEKLISRRQELYQVLEASGVKRAVLVGCSLGGETALDVALERPELVASLVIVSAVPGGFEMQGEPPQPLIEMLSALEQGDHARVTDLQMRLSLDGPFRLPDQVDPYIRQQAIEMHQKALAKGTWGLTLVPPPDPLDPPTIQLLGQIQIPTLIIAGELDNPEILRSADVMAAGIQGAQKVIIPNTAHLPNMEKPVEFNKAVQDFL